MDPHELRLNCLQMAYELGGKPEAIISAAHDLMSFVTNGHTEAVTASAPEEKVTDEASAEVTVAAPDQSPDDRIAACGTALEMPESGDLSEATSAGVDPFTSVAEGAAQIEAVEVAAVRTDEPIAITSVENAGDEAAPPTDEALVDESNGASADLAAAETTAGDDSRAIAANADATPSSESPTPEAVA